MTEELQTGGSAAFLARLVLAATLSASYGIYGPAFELQEHAPRTAGLRGVRRTRRSTRSATWDSTSPTASPAFVGHGEPNPAGAPGPAAQRHACASTTSTTTSSSPTPRPGLVDEPPVARSPATHAADAGPDVVVVVVNLDHRYAQSGWVNLDLESLGVDPDRPLRRARPADRRPLSCGGGARNFVRLDPAVRALPTSSRSTGRMPVAGSAGRAP